jgi:hypothetical protein
MADIVLINPKFEISFFGLEHALALVGKRANMPVAALPLLAALTMIYVLRCATHYHPHRLVLALTARDRPLVNTF